MVRMSRRLNKYFIERGLDDKILLDAIFELDRVHIPYKNFSYDIDELNRGPHIRSKPYMVKVYRDDKWEHTLLLKHFIKNGIDLYEGQNINASRKNEDRDICRILRFFRNLGGYKSFTGEYEGESIILSKFFDNSFDQRIIKLYIDSLNGEEEKIRSIVWSDIKKILDSMVVMSYKLNYFFQKEDSLDRLLVVRAEKVRYSKRIKVYLDAISRLFGVKVDLENIVKELEPVVDKLGKGREDETGLIIFGDLRSPNVLIDYKRENNNKGVPFEYVQGKVKESERVISEIGMQDFGSVCIGDICVDPATLLNDYWLDLFNFRISDLKRYFSYYLVQYNNLVEGKRDCESVSKDSVNIIKECSDKSLEEMSDDFVIGSIWSRLKEMGVIALFNFTNNKKYEDYVIRSESNKFLSKNRLYHAEVLIPNHAKRLIEIINHNHNFKYFLGFLEECVSKSK